MKIRVQKKNENENEAFIYLYNVTHLSDINPVVVRQYLK